MPQILRRRDSVNEDFSFADVVAEVEKGDLEVRF